MPFLRFMPFLRKKSDCLLLYILSNRPYVVKQINRRWIAYNDLDAAKKFSRNRSNVSSVKIPANAGVLCAFSSSNDLSNLPDPVQLNIKYALFRAVLSRHSAKDVAVGIAQIGTELAKESKRHTLQDSTINYT